LTTACILDADRPHVFRDRLPGASGLELLEEELELRLEVARDRPARAHREVPDRFLEGAESLLARLVEELLRRLAGLALGAGMIGQPAVHRLPQQSGECRMIEHHVLEPGRQMNLGRVVFRKDAEILLRKGRCAVLDGSRHPVLLARDLRDAADDVEVDRHPLERAVGRHAPAVRRTGLDRHLGGALRAADSAEIPGHVGPEFLGSRVLLPDFADLPADRDLDAVRLMGADEPREMRAILVVRLLLEIERRLRQVHERRRVDVDLEEGGRDRVEDEGSAAASLFIFFAFVWKWSPWMKTGPSHPSRTAAASTTAEYSAGRWPVYPISLRAISKMKAPASVRRATRKIARAVS
jgi:hypothetical protein